MCTFRRLLGGTCPVKKQSALAVVAQSVGLSSHNRKVVGSVPNRVHAWDAGSILDPWSGCLHTLQNLQSRHVQEIANRCFSPTLNFVSLPSSPPSSVSKSNENKCTHVRIIYIYTYTHIHTYTYTHIHTGSSRRPVVGRVIIWV